MKQFIENHEELKSTAKAVQGNPSQIYKSKLSLLQKIHPKYALINLD